MSDPSHSSTADRRDPTSPPDVGLAGGSELEKLIDRLARLEAEVADLRTREDLRTLVYRYAVAADARDVDTVGGLFSAEANFGPHGTGPEGARSFYEEALAGSPLMILNVGNVLLEIDDDSHARGVVYCRGELESGDEWVVQQIMYRDRYVREPAGWRFRSRQHLLFYGADLLTRPIGLPPAGKPETFKGRGSAPNIWPTFQAFWDRHPEPTRH
jgi:hypothetical protein